MITVPIFTSTTRPRFPMIPDQNVSYLHVWVRDHGRRPGLAGGMAGRGAGQGAGLRGRFRGLCGRAA